MLNKRGLSFRCILQPNMRTRGITSRCKDLKHILFLDYDNIERWLVEDELEILQTRYSLSPFYLFSSEEKICKLSGKKVGNYHAICLTKMPVRMVSLIQSDSHIDFNYRRVFKTSRYKAWVLRILPKGDKERPKFLKIVGKNKNLNKKISEAHLKALNKFYAIPFVNYKNLDGESRTFFTDYNTGALGRLK